MTRVVLAVLCSLIAVPAFAQGPSLKVPYKVQFCWDGKENDGVTPAVGPVQVRVTIDATAQPLVALPAPSGTTGCTAGSQLYILTGFSSSKGSHTVTATLVTPDGEGTAPAPFAFTVVGRPPSTVSGLQATQ